MSERGDGPPAPPTGVSGTRELPVAQARKEAHRISSRLLDRLGVGGRVAGPGAVAVPCPGGPEWRSSAYRVHHVWSLYDPRTGTLAEGMRNLREGLPALGWTVLGDQPAASAARNPELTAADPATGYTLLAEWVRDPPPHLTPLIHLALDSPRYRLPSG